MGREKLALLSRLNFASDKVINVRFAHDKVMKWSNVKIIKQKQCRREFEFALARDVEWQLVAQISIK